MKKKDIVMLITDTSIKSIILENIIKDGFTPYLVCISQAPEFLKHNVTQIILIIIDTDKSIENLTSFLTLYNSAIEYTSIPLIITTSNGQEEELYLNYNVWDFITKPIKNCAFQLRAKNAIQHSRFTLADKLLYLSNHDPVSGIYNKSYFFAITRKLLNEHPSKNFAIFYFDIQRFRLINAFFGRHEGDKVIKYIAAHLQQYQMIFPHFSYGHMSGDIFSFCVSFNTRDQLIDLSNTLYNNLEAYPLPFAIQPRIGITLVKDNKTDINILFDQAVLASKNCSINYLQHFCFYENSMNDKSIEEQYVVNNMKNALANDQFIIYLQPKYDLRTNTIDGAEALVRWNNPEQGLISPNVFIPIFEHNGFIVNLDFYIWNQVCKLLRRWLDEGRPIYPISVNISRVDLFNPKLVDTICVLVNKYNLSPKLLQLELTESAYTSNPQLIKKRMASLREKGFTILMDDFGTGYSSLNMLKDIIVDILKIDMRFLSDCEIPGRGENILSSIVRMAKWLDLLVIVEGVETAEQVNFLRNIGCEYVQGYYFSKPISIEDFEKLIAKKSTFISPTPDTSPTISADDVWNTTSQLESLFSNILQAMALYEFDGTNIEVLRGNDTYHAMFGYQEAATIRHIFVDVISDSDYENIWSAFHKVASNHQKAECEFFRKSKNGKSKWINMKLKYIRKMANKDIILVNLCDVTSQKIMEMEVLKYRTALASKENTPQTILIIDDAEVNRTILTNIFKSDFHVIQATDAKNALCTLKKYNSSIDLIMLDLVMPEMDGITFLERKFTIPEIAGIPVIVITADDSPQQQNRLLDMGIKDYIVKPFVPAILQQRVKNVFESIKYYNNKLEKIK
ncbi:EAL domain-containing protein [Megasphaera sueciensis]|jgi:diguanylate cyclase (GGDEF)-like protein/PAS domain S-box-containing protein|uniref:EAL domain-containing protein n=1 Tax=Megasphaera sueciensis TaxID=349094 RepID=UPI003D0087D8|nr:EAL domain-containing protein [Megasphaera sp.]